MSRKLVTKIYEHKVGSMLRKAVLTAMADRANDDGTGVWTSKQRIATEIEASRQGVVNAIKGLVADGLLIEVGERAHANGWTMEYSINVDAVAALPTRAQDADDPPNFVGVQKVNTPPNPVGVTPTPGVSHPPTPFTQTVLNRPEPTEAKASVSDAPEAIVGKSRKPKALKPVPELEPALEAYQRLAKRLNATHGKRIWPEVKAFTLKRQAALKARIKEHGLEAWGNVLRKAYASPLCTGQKGSWAADFDFLTSPDGFLKTLEGKYDDRASSHPTGAGSRNSGGNGRGPDAFDRLAERLQGGSDRQDAWQHDEPGAEGGYIIEAGPARLAG